MSVKGIFKILIGTMVLMVVIPVVLELFNVSMMSNRLRQMAKTSAYQSCLLFSQETYKEKVSGGTVNMGDIKDMNGDTYISGMFYVGDNTKEIWDSIYNTEAFKAFCEKYKSEYYNLNLLYSGIKSSGKLDVVDLDWKATTDELQKNNNNSKSNDYYNNMYTATNLGLPYIDMIVVNKIYKWNLAKLLSNSNSKNIKIDSDGNQYILNSGFRCYVQDATITDCVYKTYDLSDNSTKEKIAKELEANTGVVIKGLTSKDTNQGLEIKVENDLLGNIIKDNALVTVVEVNYQIPIAYSGITPLKRIFEYVWDKQTESKLSEQSFDDSEKDNLSSKTNGKSIPSTGKLTYVLVK